MLLSKLSFAPVTALMLAATFPASAQMKADGSQSQEIADSRAELEEVAEEISELMREHHFDSSVENDPAYIAMQQRVRELAESSSSRSEFVSEFNAIWQDGPFSHVRLSVAQSTAQEMAVYLDTIRIGGGGAVLKWDDDVAILEVKTMMGLDTIEEIDAAFDEIAARRARALIVDLRENEGGAFAVKPLLAHVLREPVDGGVFVSRRWTEKNARYPTLEETQRTKPWQGWSIRTFWKDLQTLELIRMQISPSEPVFDGPVYVLVSGKTASAAELAADAFSASGRAVLIGETTAGEMLSQTFFDLPQGLQLSLPVGDYYAFHSGRIEGQGVQPHIVIDADQAMQTAKKLVGRSPPNNVRQGS